MSVSPPSDPRFAQQGQVDWVSFSNTVVPLTVEILARLQGAGVQAITYAGILELSKHFKLPELGRQRVADAVSKLGVYNGASNLLYFGFGHRSLFRHLTETVSGQKSIALCSCLGETHTEAVSGKILSALWKELGYPEDYEPSHGQFTALIKVCGGAFATSPFPELVHQMLPRNMIGPDNQYCSDPTDIARVLHALFDISTGLTKSATIVGGAECSFIAALAHWIFNLDVYVEDMDGQPLFRSSLRNSTLQSTSAQVHVTYMDLKQPDIVISQTTYVLGEPKELLVYTPNIELVLRRRIPWDCCLESTFGQAFRDLSSLPTDLGNIFGGVARIHAALAQGDPDVGDYDRLNFAHFAEASQGSAFLDSAESIFPELKDMGMRRIVENVLTKSIIETRSLLESSSLSLRRNCRCEDCPGATDQGYYCLHALAGALVDLVTSLSSVHFECEQKLHPTCFGLRAFFQNNVARSTLLPGEHERGGRNKIVEYRPVPFLTRHGIGKVLRAKSPEQRVEELITLFTGYDSFNEYFGSASPSEQWTALCRNGICVFIEGLVSMSPNPDTLCRIHVMPGRIGRSTSKGPLAFFRGYDAVIDLPSWPKLPPLDNLQLSTGMQDNMDVEQRPTLHNSLEMTPIVTEPGDGKMITLYYSISTPRGDIQIPPGSMTSLILARTGLIACAKSNCLAVPLVEDSMFTVEGGWLFENALIQTLPLTSCYIWDNMKACDIGRLAAIAVNRSGKSTDNSHSDILVRRKECLGCCMAAALRLNRDRRQTTKWMFHVI